MALRKINIVGTGVKHDRISGRVVPETHEAMLYWIMRNAKRSCWYTAGDNLKEQLGNSGIEWLFDSIRSLHGRGQSCVHSGCVNQEPVEVRRVRTNCED